MTRRRPMTMRPGQDETSLGVVALVEDRAATRATRRAVARIHEQSAAAAYAHIFTTPFPRAEGRQRWAHYPGRIVLAMLDGVPVGFVAWLGDSLDALYVLPSASGRGIGGALMERAGGTSRLWVLAENHHARGFYQRRGWRPSGRSRCQYGDVLELEYVSTPQGTGSPAVAQPSKGSGAGMASIRSVSPPLLA